MSGAFQYVFWGIFLATFRITLGSVPILPAFVGWLIVYRGIKKLDQEVSEETFSLPLKLSVLLVLLSLLGGLVETGLLSFLGSGTVFLYFPALTMTVEMILIYHLFTQSFILFKEKGMESQLELPRNRLRTYLLIQTASVLTALVAFTFYHEGYMFFAIALPIIGRIYALVMVSGLKTIADGQESTKNPVTDEG